jgi:eukaryotic-like serine/threonine-protein kinase
MGADHSTTTFRDSAEEDGGAAPRSVALEGLPLIGARYRVLGMLGGGGMGNVYLAHDTELDENVAVKLLKASLSKRRDQIDLLRREVKFARRVTHPNVLRTFDIGEHEGAKFVTMELIDGRTLADLLPRKMALSEVARIAHAVCAGLAAAHDAGVVHRDLKPSNVLLANDGRILLADFGISRLADDAADGVLAGSPGYMAPELIANEAVDARADIWALGALLFEMLTGERAFRYRSKEDLLRPLLESAPDPTEHRPEIPLALARVVTRCMARQPAARFAHPREISAAIAAALPLPSNSTSGSWPRVAVANERRARVLAVLPLTNLGAADDAHLAEGLTAVLIDGIDSRELHVPSRSAVEAAHPGGRDALQVGRDLGAEAIVSGSVGRSASGDVVIELRVIGTGDGLVLFAEKVECRLPDIVRAAEEASRSIARALLVTRKPAAPAMHDGEVVDLYLQGLQEYRRRWADSVDRSASCFQRALERAPDDPMVLAAYALCLARKLSFGGDESVTAEARAVSARALALARDRPEPHLAVAGVAIQVMENLEAARALRLALALAPHHADLQHMLGMLAIEVNSVDAGLAHLYTGLTLDPSLIHARWWIGRGHALLREWTRCDAIFATPPEDGQGLNDYWVNRTRSVFYGPTKERVASFRAELAAAPPFFIKDAVVTAVALQLGERPNPAPLNAFVEERHASKRRRCFVATLMAEIFCASGQLERAMSALAETEAASNVDIVWMDTCPLLEPLRGRDDFRQVRERVAIRAAKVRAALDGTES